MRINFVCRASKARKNGLSPIEMSIIIDSKRSIISLDRYVKCEAFNASTQKVRGDKETNEYLETIKRKCYQIENELIKINSLDIDTFVQTFKHGSVQTNDTLLKVFDKHNEVYKGNVLCGRVDNVALYKYKVARDRVETYLKSIGKSDIRLKDITPSFIEDYQNWCLLSLKPSTCNKQMKMLKRILTFAVEERYIDVNPFQLKIKEVKLQYHPLTKQEVEFIWNKTITNDKIEMVRDLFIFQCYTGLSYVDMSSLSSEDIANNVIVKQRKKTDVKSVVPLLDVPMAILQKYDYSLPKITNQAYNRYLKVLGDYCGLKQNLTTHLARHTFGTMLLNEGVDMKTISKAMGHANTKITEAVYADMLNDTVVSNILKVMK